MMQSLHCVAAVTTAAAVTGTGTAAV